MAVEAAHINSKGVATVSLWKRKSLLPAFGTVTGSFWPGIFLGGDTMTRTEVLQKLLELGGVSSAAFVSGSGELLEMLPGGAHDHDLATVQPALAGFLASSRVLAELLGAEAATQTTLELGAGAALLTLLSDPSEGLPEASPTVVALTTVDELDRVRFALRRLLPQLTAEPSARRG
jgi:hypothetical protein